MEAAVKAGICDVLDHEWRLREMPANRYIVRLTEDERAELLNLISKGKASARVLTRARIRLKAAEGWKDKDIVEALGREVATLEAERNTGQSTVHWRFTTEVARIKLLYPSYSN